MVKGEIFPRPGERVLVPWGLEEVLGEVVEIYSTGLGDRAVVHLLDSSDPDATVTVPADSLVPASGPTRGISTRLDAVGFENRVLEAIRQVARMLEVKLYERREIDRGIDAIISNKRREVAIQIKYFATNRLPSDAIATLMAYASPRRPVVVIANAGLTAAAAERLERINRSVQIVWFLRWTNESDISPLLDTIQEALASLGPTN
jgi:hypothetical protein